MGTVLETTGYVAMVTVLETTRYVAWVHVKKLLGDVLDSMLETMSLLLFPMKMIVYEVLLCVYAKTFIWYLSIHKLNLFSNCCYCSDSRYQTNRDPTRKK